MKKTISKFIAAALTITTVMSSAAVPVSAEENYWSKAAVTDSTAASPKSYNNSSYYTATDKCGRAYPYQYYHFASDPTAKVAYEKLYNALCERKSQVSFTREEVKAFDKLSNGIAAILCDLKDDCPYFYYVKNHDVSISGDGESWRKIFTLSYMSEKEINKYQKKFDSVVDDFDDYLAECNAASTKAFYECAMNYLGSIAEYDYDAANGKKSRGNCENIIGAFIEGKIVCEGYVKAFNYLCGTHGVSFAYKGCESTGDEAGHAFSLVPYKNVWYNMDPTAYKKSERQYLTDAEVKSKCGYVTDWRFDNPIPKCNGKVIPTSISGEVKEAETTAITAKLKESHFKSFKAFKKAYTTCYNAAEKAGATVIKIKVPDGYVNTAIKHIKKLKVDGVFTYSKLYKGTNYVKVVL